MFSLQILILRLFSQPLSDLVLKTEVDTIDSTWGPPAAWFYQPWLVDIDLMGADVLIFLKNTTKDHSVPSTWMQTAAFKLK